jgi:putative transposase
MTSPEGRQRMSHSYSSNLIHLVFSTKDRQHLIRPEIEPRLWEFVVAIGRNHGVRILAVGGMSDHLHLLYHLPKTMTLADSVRILKANSSRWMRETSVRFAWQRGSGSFSVSASNKAAVMRYIVDQKQHHRKMSYEQEFVALLQKSEIAYDPQYVFG